MIEYLVVSFSALLFGCIVGAIFVKRRWNCERQEWRKWQDDKLKKIRSYENMYRFREEVVDGRKVQFATFDGGKQWYQVQQDADGLHVMLSPDEVAGAVLVENLIQQSHIEAAVRRGLAF